MSGMRMDFVRTFYAPLTQETFEALQQQFADLACQANRWFDEEFVPVARRNIRAAVDLRYSGQAYELTVPVSSTAGSAGYDELVASFVAAHRERYGYVVDGEGIQVTAVRAEAYETLSFAHPANEKPKRAGPITPVEHRDILDLGELKAFPTPVYRKEVLPQEVPIAGPCVIEQMDTTIHVLRDQRAIVDIHDNVIISIG
jgi:N-methylhydantoinase A